MRDRSTGTAGSPERTDTKAVRTNTADESRRERWTRRALTIPLFVVLTIVIVGGLPLWLAAALVVDVVRRAPWVATRCVLFFAVYLLCEVVGIAASLALWRPGMLGDRSLDRHYRLQQWWAGALFEGGRRIFDFDVTVEGEKEVGHGPVLVLIRHASTADTPLPVVLLNVRHGLRMRYVLKRELLWDPCLDLVGHRLPNVFVRRGSGDPQREAARVAGLARDLGPRDGVLIYPEGTRFSPAKRERALAVISERGELERLARVLMLRHVLPPRPAGVLALLAAAPAADVLVIAHTGFEDSSRFTNFWNGALVGQRIHVRLWRVPRREIPETVDARVAWLDDQWARIDDWIARHRDGTAVPR
jgi:1-acyl-sn-glycerol-3-phosphate acyltransferase